MRRSLSFWQRVGLGVGLALAGIGPLWAQDEATGPVAVLTQHNDNARTGENTRETTLTLANVKADTFGKLFTRSVDGYLYAQPLYVPNLRVPGKGIHNVVFLATAHDSVYCFDADDPKASEPIWKVSLGTPVPATEIYDPAKTPWTDMLVDIGITSTPVIDLDTHTIYVEAKTKEKGTYVQRLHALDLVTGAERKGSPVVIQAKVKGTGDASENGMLSFDPVKQLQRPGLLLSDGVVYLAFGSHADSPPFHGWILGYDAESLQQVCVFNTAPNGSDAAIWQAGMGMAADEAGNIYAMTGNGTFTANTPGGVDYGDTMLKLHPSGKGLTVLDYFTPYNQDAMNAGDADLGGSGPMLIPDTHLIIGGGKNGFLYVVRRDRMGKYKPDSDTQIAQSWHLDGSSNIHGSPVFWDSPVGPLIYIMAENDHVKAFRMIQNTFRMTPDSQSDVAAPGGMPGGFLSVSANGNLPGTGILWACHPYDADANHQTVPGVLRAYDAQDLTHELWDSKQNAGRDDLGMFAKFCVPTIANGKVFVSTFSNQLQVYGLLDGVLPSIDSVSATSAHLVVHYKKPVEAHTAAKAANYALDNGARVLRASLDPDGKTVYLATTPLHSGTQYTLTAQGVRDRDNPKLALPPATHAWVRPGAKTASR